VASGATPDSLWLSARGNDLLHLPTVDLVLFGEEPLRQWSTWTVQAGNVVGEHSLLRSLRRFGVDIAERARPELVGRIRWLWAHGVTGQQHQEFVGVDECERRPCADERTDGTVVQAMGQIGADRCDDAHAHAPLGQRWYSLVPAAGVEDTIDAAQMRPSTVNGIRRAVVPDSP
jgi:hypothetical protein